MDIHKIIEGKTLIELYDMLFMLWGEIMKRNEVRFNFLAKKVGENDGNNKRSETV